MCLIVAVENNWLIRGIYYDCIEWLQVRITGCWVALIMNVPNGCSWELLLYGEILFIPVFHVCAGAYWLLIVVFCIVGFL